MYSRPLWPSDAAAGNRILNTCVCCASGKLVGGGAAGHYNKSRSVFLPPYMTWVTYERGPVIAFFLSFFFFYPLLLDLPLHTHGSYYRRNMRGLLVWRVFCGSFDSQFSPADLFLQQLEAKAVTHTRSQREKAVLFLCNLISNHLLLPICRRAFCITTDSDFSQQSLYMLQKKKKSKNLLCQKCIRIGKIYYGFELWKENLFNSHSLTKMYWFII